MWGAPWKYARQHCKRIKATARLNQIQIAAEQIEGGIAAVLPELEGETAIDDDRDGRTPIIHHYHTVSPRSQLATSCQDCKENFSISQVF